MLLLKMHDTINLGKHRQLNFFYLHWGGNKRVIK